MPTRRTPLQRDRLPPQISEAAVEAFLRAREIHDDAEVESAANRTGAQGPIQSEYNAARSTCHRETGGKPWQTNPLDVGPWPKPLYLSDDDWRRARELRAALLEAAGLEPETDAQ